MPPGRNNAHLLLILTSRQWPVDTSFRLSRTSFTQSLKREAHVARTVLRSGSPAYRLTKFGATFDHHPPICEFVAKY